MTKEEIISGLKMSMDLTLFDPSTGEVMEPRQLNDINRTAYEAYKGAIELLEKQPYTTTHDSIPAKTGKNDGDRTSGDCISRWASLEAIRTMQTYKLFEGDDMILIDKAQAQTELMMLPSIQPDTTTNDSIPAETGENDEDRTGGDCISRQQAIEVIKRCKTAEQSQSGEVRNWTVDTCADAVKRLPSVQPERKTGRWIPTASGKGRHECSRCHEYAPCYQDGSEHLSTFCVLCGAKMERGEEE